MSNSIELACEICYHAYNLGDRQPLILKDCGHTFCSHCIKGQLLKQKNGIICPVCRKVTPSKKISDFPKNYLVIKLMEHQLYSQSSISDLNSQQVTKKAENQKDRKAEIQKERRVSFSKDLEIIEVFSQSQKKQKTEDPSKQKQDQPTSKSNKTNGIHKNEESKSSKESKKLNDDLVIFIGEENILKSKNPKKAETKAKKKAQKLVMEDETEVEDDAEAPPARKPKMKTVFERKPTKLIPDEEEDEEFQIQTTKTTKKTTKIQNKAESKKEVVIQSDSDEEISIIKALTEDTTNSKRNTYQVMFTGFDKNDTQLTKDQKKMQTLGVKIVEEIEKPFNVLVMDKFKRTIKFLLALNRGMDIVSHHWVKDSIKKGYLLPPSDYPYQDRAAEVKHNFKFALSIQKAKAKKNGILNGYKVYIPPHITPSYEELKLLIESCDGVVTKARPVEDKSDTLIIINEDDEKIAQTLRSQYIKSYSTELLYSGILNQKLDLTSNKVTN